MKTIIAAINLVIATGFGALRIYKAAKGDATPTEKIEKIHAELGAILTKLQTLAQNTEPTWDDDLALALSSALDAIAESLIEALEDK